MPKKSLIEKRGRPPGPPKKLISTRVELDVLEAIEKDAEATGVSVSALLEKRLTELYFVILEAP